MSFIDSYKGLVYLKQSAVTEANSPGRGRRHSPHNTPTPEQGAQKHSTASGSKQEETKTHFSMEGGRNEMWAAEEGHSRFQGFR